MEQREEVTGKRMLAPLSLLQCRGIATNMMHGDNVSDWMKAEIIDFRVNEITSEGVVLTAVERHRKD